MPDEMNNDPLEQAHQSVYGQQAAPTVHRSPLSALREQIVPRDWGTLAPAATTRGKRHVRFATIFLAVSASFFLIALVVVGYLLYFGNNSVSANKITIDIQGPTTIAGGDTVPLSIAITNKNAIAINDATIEIDFPNSTRSATDVLSDYPRYIDNLGTIPSGGTVTRSIKAIIFGGAGQALSLPVVLSYNISTSNGTFQKKTSYDLAISSTPLSVSVDTLNEITPGQPLSFTLTVRSNANVAISNVMLVPQFPFGFSIASSSVPFSNAGFALGTFAPGATQRVTFVGTVAGQDNDQKMFHFAVGTAKSAKDQSLAITYMSQDASVTLTSPFITTSIAINGTSESNIVLTPGSIQNVSLSYTNTLATVITNASIVVSVTGSGINYDSIRAGSGFYNSSDHTIVFNRDTNPALAMLAPGASGMGSFSFLTLPAGVASPNIVFTTNASGTRIGQENVPEQVTTSVVKAIKVVTSPTIVAMAERNTSPFSETGPIPPVANQATTYAIVLQAKNQGSTIAGGVMTTTLPSYVTYTGKTSGSGAFSYDNHSRSITWTAGDITQGGTAQGIFQVSLLPSISQKGGPAQLTNSVSFSGYDRFAGVSVSATAVPVTTETKQEPGYILANGSVQ